MIAGPRVLVVEDHARLRHGFQHAFADSCDFVTSYGALVNADPPEGGWDYAFVDFNLGPGSRFSGLSVLRHLQLASPRTRTIVYTQMEEPGREMFAVAARLWFDAWGIVAKGDDSDEVLARIKIGENPTPALWIEAWKTGARTLDPLFPDATWTAYWQAACEFHGQAAMMADRLGLRYKRDLDRTYTARAKIVGNDFASQFQARRNPFDFDNRSNAVQIGAFAHLNAPFFLAPDLPDIVAHVMPWRRG